MIEGDRNDPEEELLMRYEWMDDFLMNKPGVTKDLQKDWNWIRYQIGGKMFAANCLSDDDKPIILRLSLIRWKEIS